MQPAARQNDTHVCNQHQGQYIQEGSPNIFINGQPAARTGDKALCENNGDNSIIQGSTTVFLNGKSAARVQDPLQHGGQISGGSPNVNIGSNGHPVSIGSKGIIHIGGNGKNVNIGS